jgi:uncharacterized protein (DUF1810 family)
MTCDPFDLNRFLVAQAPVIENVRRELAQGLKRTHWMWFVFPQIAGLGRSAMAERYAIRSLDEAAAYGAHCQLGARLRECTRLVLRSGSRTISEIFGSPDDLKFHSSMTLFAHAAPSEELFRTALCLYFDGVEDAATLARLSRTV